MPKRVKKQRKLDNQITFYQAPDGAVNIEVLYADENIWLTQKLMALLYDVSTPTINEHLKNIFETHELEEGSVIRNFRITAADGKIYNTKHYSLEAIIAVGYRVGSERGTQFRQWATKMLRNYIHKGYALDSDRFKHGSRFDQCFFDDLLEEIRDIRSSERASSSKPYMGLTTWRRSPKGKIMPSDIVIAKNYLGLKELDHLNRIVSMYLDYAEL